MTVAELERRVTALEEQVKQLVSRRGEADTIRRPNWQKAVEEFRGDEDVLAVIREGMKLREKERKAVRAKLRKRRARS